MALTITDVNWTPRNIVATNPNIIDNKGKPNRVIQEFIFSMQGTGDATGGGVYWEIDFGDFSTKYYFVVTDIKPSWVGSNKIYIYTHTDRWENFFSEGHSNETLILYNSTALSYAPPYQDMLIKPMCMGKPNNRDANPGLCHGVLSTNTDTETYNMIILGYTLERPLPFASIIQP